MAIQNGCVGAVFILQKASMVRILNTIHSSTTDFTHQNRPLLVCFNDFWNFSLLKGAQKSLFLGLISLEILVFPKNDDLDRPEFVFEPY